LHKPVVGVVGDRVGPGPVVILVDSPV